MKLTILLGFIVLWGCPASTTTTPAPPNSPQTQALNVTKTLADAINAAVKTTIAERNAGKVSQADTTTIENWAKSAAVLDDTIATELGSADPWATQKAKIIAMMPLFRIPGTGTTDVTLQAALAAVSTLLTQLQGVVQ